LTCRIEDEDELAAETGITETTLDQTSYKHQSNPNILFWDLPGIGTMNYPDLPIFCRKVGIEKYDTFLIVCHTRFTQYDLMLAEKVKSMGKSFFFVRTKVDQAMKSEKRKKKTAFDEEKVLKILKDDCVKNLASKAFEVAEERVFLISSHYPTQWDFERLEKAILDQLPVKQKEALMLSLHTKSKDILKEKLQLIKGICVIPSLRLKPAGRQIKFVWLFIKIFEKLFKH
jgi:GTPase Era involved in 16S rRNA processing